MNSQLCLIMILNGFNISCSLGKQSNNVFYGFSSVKCATSGILPVSRCEQNEIDDFFKLTNRPTIINSYKKSYPFEYIIQCSDCK